MLDKPRLAAGLTLGAFALTLVAAVARFAPDATGSLIGTAVAGPAMPAAEQTVRPAEIPWGAVATRLAMGN